MFRNGDVPAAIQLQREGFPLPRWIIDQCGIYFIGMFADGFENIIDGSLFDGTFAMDILFSGFQVEFDEAIPAPSCPRLCCFSIRR